MRGRINSTKIVVTAKAERHWNKNFIKSPSRDFSKWYFRENRMWNSLQLAVLANGGSGQQKRITSSQDITWPFVLVHVSFEIYILYKHCPAKWVYRTRGFLKMGKVLQAWVLFFPLRQTWIKSLLLNHIEEHSWTETVQTWAPVKSLSSMSQT